MKDELKTKEQLINELIELRKGITESEELQITHKRTRDGLQESEDKFRKISDIANDAIIIIDEEGKIYFWNKTAEEIFGYTSQEALGKGLELIIPRKYRDAHKEGFNRFITTGKRRITAKRLELKAIGKDKPEFPVEISLSAVKMQGKWNAIGIIRDITERKKMEEALRKSREELSEKVKERTLELATANEQLKQEMKERMEMQEKLIRSEKLAAVGKIAGGIGHDLRNPLNIIDNSALYISEVLKDVNGKVRKQLNIIHKTVQRASKIVTDLLDFSQAKPLCFEKCNANNIIEEALSNIETPENITVEIHLDEDIPEILIDAHQIQRVFLNIISNAFRAMPGGGSLSIRSTLRPALSKDRTGTGIVEIDFKDTGEGIKGENLEKIFEPLFTTRSKGIGLGMVIVKDIIDKHNGTIDVQSKVGRGTTFTVKLPRKI